MELPFLWLLWGLSDQKISELCEMPWSFNIKFHSETQVCCRLDMPGGRSPRHAQNPLVGEQRKTLSITHHALSPPPSHHHLYIIHHINLLQRFYRIIMSFKRPFVPKSDVKQLFTTTTTTMLKLDKYVIAFNIFGLIRVTSVHAMCDHYSFHVWQHAHSNYGYLNISRHSLITAVL